MDSLTQFALGAGVGAAVLGRRIGPRKAAVVGGLLGTLPDLDVLFPFADPIDSFTLHRGASHSFVVQALVTPLFGEAMVRLFEGLRDRRLQTYLAVFLIFVTHAALDALT
ncbi:MAG: metal-dependent hydrolase, partial [Bacteroidota bacterium]